MFCSNTMVNTILIEAIINIIGSKEEKSTNNQMKGVSVGEIYDSLKTYHFDYQIDLSYSNIFSVLCQIEGSQFFNFERADIFDIYFSLKGTREELLRKVKELPKNQLSNFDTNMYKTEIPDIKMENFYMLSNLIDSSIKTQLELKKKNIEL